MTDWKDSRVMLLDTESLSLASITWELVIRCDVFLEDEDKYLEDELSPTVFVVEIELSYL